MTDQPRYPDARVRLHSQHPLAIMGAVREALRRVGAGADEVERFTSGAAAVGEDEVVNWCREWAKLDFYPQQGTENG